MVNHSADDQRRAIEELYKDALYVVTVKQNEETHVFGNEGYFMVVFDKAPEGAYQRDHAAEAFAKTHGQELKYMEDLIEFKTESGTIYPAMYLPLQMLNEKTKVIEPLPELPVLLDLALRVPGMIKREKPDEQPGLKLDRLRKMDASDAERKPFKAEPVYSHIKHVQGEERDYNAEERGYGQQVTQLLEKREAEVAVGLKFEHLKAEHHKDLTFNDRTDHYAEPIDGLPNAEGKPGNILPVHNEEAKKKLAGKVAGLTPEGKKVPERLN